MQKQIKNSLEILKNKGVLLYPTDTIWGLGGDATSDIAVAKIYEMKKRASDKSLIVLVNDLEMLKKYVKVSENILNMLKTFSKPTTLIYEYPKNLSEKLIAKDDTVAIRIVKNDFCKHLIKQFGKPITATSANISGESSPHKFSDISEKIKNKVDYVVDWERQKTCENPSTILKIKDNKILKIRI